MDRQASPAVERGGLSGALPYFHEPLFAVARVRAVVAVALTARKHPPNADSGNRNHAQRDTRDDRRAHALRAVGLIGRIDLELV